MDTPLHKVISNTYSKEERRINMSCGKEMHTGSCVCNVLKEIARAQKDITEFHCDTSCEKSINDLLGDTEVRNNLDTVPFILYCDSSCKPFKGYGAHPRNISKIVSSYYFRVKSVTNDCCAVIELLRDPGDNNFHPKDPADQQTKHLRATGICMTIDAKCFCHITCLPAINACS